MSWCAPTVPVAPWSCRMWQDIVNGGGVSGAGGGFGVDLN